MLSSVGRLTEGRSDVVNTELFADIKEVDGERLLSVLESRIDSGLLHIDGGPKNSAPEPEPTSSKSVRDMYTEGSIKSRAALEISWDEVCNLFEGIYINWNPGLFRYSLDFHGYVYVPCCLRVNYVTNVCLAFAPGSGRLIIRKTRGYVSLSSSVVYFEADIFLPDQLQIATYDSS
jgi:hypothetical protein